MEITVDPASNPLAGFIPSNPWGTAELVTTDQPTARTLRRQAKEQYRADLKRATLQELLPTPPNRGDTIHLISNGRYDYFTFVSIFLAWLQNRCTGFYGSTWTMNAGNVTSLLRYYDHGQIAKITVATGTYFYRRESAVANQLILGLAKRGQRTKAWENHAKVICMTNGVDFYVAEGSANWTANPRTENNSISNSPDLYRFHAAWIEEMFAREEKPK